jgi:hypothetical protein
MWLLLGIAAIITAILNVIWSIRDKEAKWFRFISLSLTALTLCAFNSLYADWVLNEEWTSLSDVVPTVSNALWILVIASILINSFSLFKKNSG